MRALVIGIQLEREFPGVLDIEIDGETRHKREVKT